jgi:hypothetical protein
MNSNDKLALWREPRRGIVRWGKKCMKLGGFHIKKTPQPLEYIVDSKSKGEKKPTPTDWSPHYPISKIFTFARHMKQRGAPQIDAETNLITGVFFKLMKQVMCIH